MIELSLSVNVERKYFSISYPSNKNKQTCLPQLLESVVILPQIYMLKRQASTNPWRLVVFQRIPVSTSYDILGSYLPFHRPLSSHGRVEEQSYRAEQQIYPRLTLTLTKNWCLVLSSFYAGLLICFVYHFVCCVCFCSCSSQFPTSRFTTLLPSREQFEEQRSATNLLQAKEPLLGDNFTGQLYLDLTERGEVTLLATMFWQ